MFDIFLHPLAKSTYLHDRLIEIIILIPSRKVNSHLYQIPTNPIDIIGYTVYTIKNSEFSGLKRLALAVEPGRG